MLVKRSLQAGLITGLAMILLALVITIWLAQLRTVWPVMFAPVFFTGVCAVLRGGRTVTTVWAALLAGAVAGLATAALSVFGLSLANIITARTGGAFTIVGILADSPYYIPRERLWLDLPWLLPFPWPYARTLADGVTVSRIPVPWLWFFPVGTVGAALQAWLYYAVARQLQLGGQVVVRLARYRASFQSKLLLGFALLGVLIFVVGWLGFAAMQEMHNTVHRGRVTQHWLDHAFQIQASLQAQTAALPRLTTAGDEAALQAVVSSGQKIAADLTHLKQVPPPVHPTTTVSSTSLVLEAGKRLPAVQEIDTHFGAFNQAALRAVEFYRGGNATEAQALLLAMRPQQEAVDASLWRLANALHAELVVWAAQMDDEQHSQEPVMMLLVLVTTGVAFPLGYVFSQVVVRPVSAVSKGLQRIGSGDFSASVQVDNRDELGELARRVNETSGELARLYDQVQTRTQELARSVEEQKALAEVGQAVGSTLDVQTVLTTIVAHAVELSGADAGTIYEFDDATQQFKLRATHQMSDELVAAIRETPISLDDPGLGQAATLRQAIQIPDIRDMPAFPMRAVLEQAGFRALLVVPLLREERIIGSLVVRRRQPGRFPDETVELLQTFATQSGLAIQNARLFQEIEEKGRQLEIASQHKSQFLANMSHELRTPLNAILGYSEMLHEEAEDLGYADFIPDLQKIHAAGKHLLALINDILDLSKIEAGKMDLFLETFDIAPMVQDVVSLVQPLVEKNANTLVVHHADDLGVMWADLTKVRQALFNLLSNACKFTKQGTIALAVARDTVDGAAWLTFRVNDTGIGIAPEQIGKLFQAFSQADTTTTRQYGGTGLGLVITQRFCHMMGGDITVESALDQGSTFIIRLPAEIADPKAAGQPREEEAQARAASLPEGAPAVLVIDDDPTVHDLMQHFLSKEGLRVVAAASGAEGLRLAKALRPAVITLDVLMPGMDGWTVLTELKGDPTLADIPVIMLTIVEDKNMGYALGAAEYLTKPIDWERLAAVLQKYRCTHPPCPMLVIEDDATMREMLRRMLERAGWAVCEAANGHEALERLAEHRPELIVLDLMMPEMDGFQFLDALRQHDAWRSIPIVVVTAKDLTEEDRQRLKGSVERILQKGAYSREELLHEVRALVAACVQPGRPGPEEE